jgi:hypothetical protein
LPRISDVKTRGDGKALKAIEKAVRKAVHKGVTTKVVDSAVEKAIAKGTKRKKAVAKKSKPVKPEVDVT